MMLVFLKFVGNVARPAFENPSKLSEVLEIDEELIVNLPVGQISEEPTEARNKFGREYLTRHARRL